MPTREYAVSFNDTPHDRYLRDPAFHSLVDMMTAQIISAKFSPSEMRDAAVLASIRFEAMQVRQRVIYVNTAGEAAVEGFNWV